MLFAIVSASAILPVQADERTSEETWVSIRPDFFDDVAIHNGAFLMTMEAPKRAHDAAAVPIKISVKPESGIVKITLLIDQNPVPLAGVFEFGPAAANASFSTRIRVNSYSYVRAVAETADGKLYMVKKYVKAAGGCSAPASKDMDKAIAEMGKMKLRLFSNEAAALPPQSGARAAQLMIRHPNNSGFQMDQVTMLYVPAHFVDMIEVTYGKKLVMKVEGAISLSEDPNIRFFYRHSGAGEIRVRATDNEEGEFVRSWTVTGS
jgi:sulfur-oxidizing protein SoxY